MGAGADNLGATSGLAVEIRSTDPISAAASGHVGFGVTREVFGGGPIISETLLQLGVGCVQKHIEKQERQLVHGVNSSDGQKERRARRDGCATAASQRKREIQ